MTWQVTEKKNLESIREYDRKRGKTAKRIALSAARTAEYRKTHPDRGQCPPKSKQGYRDRQDNKDFGM